MDVLSFTAPEAGIYNFQIIEHADDSLIYARSLCRLPDSELACNDDFGGSLNSGIEVELEAEQAIFVFVDSYAGDNAAAYTLQASRGPLPQ